MTGLNTASAATGAKVLQDANWPGHGVHDATKATAIGSAILMGGLTLLCCCCGTPGLGIKDPVTGAAALAGNATVSALIGAWHLGLSPGMLAAEAATGGAIVGGSLGCFAALCLNPND